MPIQAVVNAIEHARTEIAIFPDTNLWREPSTRYAVIDPILRGLGWSTHKSLECEVELPVGKSGKKVDYALLDRDTNIVILIEAKRLDGSLWSSHERQLSEYSEELELSAAIGVLTSGTEWYIYNIENADVKELDHVYIFDEPTVKAARRLHKWLNRRRWW